MDFIAQMGEVSGCAVYDQRDQTRLDGFLPIEEAPSYVIRHITEASVMNTTSVFPGGAFKRR
jgi:hypothetical protein